MNSKNINRISKYAFVDKKTKIGKNVTICHFASIRADEGPIEIGDNSNVQDCCVIHDKTKIGNNVTIGHGAVVHGCIVSDNVLIGMNATILSGADIGEWCIIAAGCVIKENEKIPSNSLVAGVPGKILRQLTEKDRKLITDSWKNYVENVKTLE